MNAVLQIFLYNIVPIFIMILIGIFLGRKFELDINTLTKVNFYVTVPAFTFNRLYKTELGSDQLVVLAFALALLIILALVGDLAARARGHEIGMRKAFQNSVMFFNSGNIGVPLISLVFSTGIYVVDGKTPYLDLAVTTQVVMLVVQNLTTNTFGYYNASVAKSGGLSALKQVFSMPTTYAVPLALILKLIPVDFTKLFFWPAVDMASNALICISLFTLGVQLTRTKFEFGNKDAWLAVFLRLVGGPLLAWGLIQLFGITGIVARALFIASAVPTAVNTSLIAVENDNHPDFASQVVLISTVLCGVTLIGVIWLASLLFPI